MFKLCLALSIAGTLSAQKAPSWEELRIDQIKILEKLDRILKSQEKTSKILEEADAPPAPPPPVKVDIQGAPMLGVPSATITIVEYTDFQCPFCSKFHLDTFPKLHDEFIASEKMRWVHRDLPLSMHKNAMQAALAGRCAGEQNHFWEMRDWMQSHPEKLEEPELFAHAMELELDLEQYHSCMATGKYRSSIEADIAEAKKIGANGTPAFVVGTPNAQGLIEGELITGNQPLAVFERAIENQKNKLAK